MKALTQTVTDLSLALRRLDPQRAFEQGVQRVAEERETALLAQGRTQRISTQIISPSEAQMRLKKEGLDE